MRWTYDADGKGKGSCKVEGTVQRERCRAGCNLYGSRRVRKASLVEEVFHDRMTFRYTGLAPVEERADDSGKGKLHNQLEHFIRSLQPQRLKEKKSLCIF